MDAIRYYLAFSVVVAHFSACTGSDIPWLTNSATAVGCFFALSGFLVFQSFYKAPNVVYFLRRRALRILPPYFSVVFFAFICGIIITNLEHIDYLTSWGTWKYLIANLSFMNFIEPRLPGVFENNIISVVNGSLWTMKVEWGLYLSIPIVAWIISRFKTNKIKLSIAIIILSIAYRFSFTLLFEATGNELYFTWGKQFLGMLSYFYSGVLFYLLYDKIMQYRWWILSVLIMIMLLADFIPYYGIILSPIIESTVVLIACFTGNWGKILDNKNNFSYDIYLFHFPVIQLWVSFTDNTFPNWLLFACCIISILIISWASWTFIGKRFVLMRERK